jgi:hypothetical protein
MTEVITTQSCFQAKRGFTNVNNKMLGILASLFLSLASCSSPEKQIQGEFDAFSSSNSTLLYEYEFTSSSATGDCGGMNIDRWYGSEVTYSDITKMYEDQLLEKGWTLWPEHVVRIWRKQTQAGLFSFYITAFTSKSMANLRNEYKLPDSLLREAAQYSTGYLISIGYMSTFAAQRCFGK